MTWKTWATAMSLGMALCGAGTKAYASDRQDGSATSTLISDPSSDIVDLYAWMEGTDKRVFMIMTVFPNANKMTSNFSSTNLYVFHTNARSSLMDTTPAPEVQIICQFDGKTPQGVQCWGGQTEYVKGGLNVTLVSQTSNNQGRLQVYAGARNDPFFLNKTNLSTAIGSIKTTFTAGVPAPDPTTKCQQYTVAQQTAIQATLNPNPAVKTDSYQGQNVLAIVVSVDPTLLTQTGKPILSVWGSVNKAQ